MTHVIAIRRRKHNTKSIGDAISNLLSISYTQVSPMKQNEMTTALFPNDVVRRINSIKGYHQVSISAALPNSSPHHVWIANGKANILSSGKTISTQRNIGTHLGWLW
jgi:hypothetical protein